MRNTLIITRKIKEYQNFVVEGNTNIQTVPRRSLQHIVEKIYFFIYSSYEMYLNLKKNIQKRE